MSPWRAIALTVFVASGLATPLGGRAIERACAASGLLCSIDGVPKTGCGTASGGHYAYWSYWHGSGGTWSYSNSGPASGRVDSAIVEGWRYQPNGSGNPTDPPPRGPARATAVCVPAPPPTTPPPTTPARTTTSAPPPPTFPSGPSPTVGAQGASNPASSTRPGTSTSRSVTTRPARASAGATPTTARRNPSTSLSSPASIAIGARGIANPATHTAQGAPVGLVTGVALVIALGAGGAIAARRRRRPAS